MGKLIIEIQKQGEIQEPASRFFYFFYQLKAFRIAGQLRPFGFSGLKSIYFKDVNGDVLMEIDYERRNFYLDYKKFWQKRIRSREEYEKESEMFTQIIDKYLRLPGFKALPRTEENFWNYLREIPHIELKKEEIKSFNPTDIHKLFISKQKSN